MDGKTVQKKWKHKNLHGHIQATLFRAALLLVELLETLDNLLDFIHTPFNSTVFTELTKHLAN